MKELKRLTHVSLLFALVLVGILFGSGTVVHAQRGGAQGPFYGSPILPTKFNGDLRTLPRASLTSNAKGLPLATPSSLGSGEPLLPTSPDAVRQNRFGEIEAPTNSIGFQGLSGG